MSSSDRSRTSDDRRNHYKAVVAQQGRVIVDRDVNALETILSERADADVLDIVGPAGTPDDGFKISVPTQSPPASSLSPAGTPSFDFQVGPGTMYVGGQRVEFPAVVDDTAQTYSYFLQPDWLDPDDPVPAGSPPSIAGESPPTGIEVTWLDVFEQEVQATEDPDLKEVALGGPDTTARVRLMRRVRRTPVHEEDCAAAWLEATGTWSTGFGLEFDPDTMRLVPEVRLQVSFQQDPATGDLCDPVARGGYLYSENQLIRIQISAAAGADGSPARFLWGYDNASFLYRVSSVTNGGTQLQLADSPPDAFHWPKSGQVVQILRTAVVLGTAPDANDPAATIVRCVAQAAGEIRTLSQSYGAATQGGTANYLTFADPLPTEYLEDPNPLFVRIWQSEQDYNAIGVALQDAASATTNGVVVTLTTPTAAPMTVGAFWMIALRPGTPQAVYPERFLNAPQPPDGPTRWACPLATIDWTTHPPTVTDCRSPFDNLVTLSKRKPGCCTISVRPEDLDATHSLQKVIDAAVAKADTVKICFGPGIYLLPDALRLGPQHAGIVLEACTDGAILRPDPNVDPTRFQDGLLVMIDSPGITLSGLYFESVDVQVSELIQRDMNILTESMAIEVNGLKLLAQFEQTRLWTNPIAVLTGAVANLFVLICVRSVWCTGLTVERCHFKAISSSAQDKQQNCLALGLLAQGNCTGIAVRDCTFSGRTGLASPGLVATGTQFVGIAAAVAAAPPPVAAPAAKKAAAKTAAAKAAASKTAVTVQQVAPDPAGMLRDLPALADFTDAGAARIVLSPIAAGVGLLIIPWIGKESRTQESVQLQFGLETRLADAEIRGNVFSDLTLASASLAQSGIVHVVDNTVRNCAAGLWFATWHGGFIQWNPAKPINRGADQLLFYALLCEETALALFLPMVLSLPPEVGQGATLPLFVSPPLPPVLPSFDVAGNDIDCAPAGAVAEFAASSFALAVFSDEITGAAIDAAINLPPIDSTLAITANHLQSRLPTIYPTVIAVLFGTLTMTGNHVINVPSTPNIKSNQSLFVDIDGFATLGKRSARLGLAVTGNVFYGLTNLIHLPRQGLPAPLNNWDTFNAVFP